MALIMLQLPTHASGTETKFIAQRPPRSVNSGGFNGASAAELLQSLVASLQALPALQPFLKVTLSPVENQPVSREETMKFTWRIEHFSSLTETKLCSDTFSVGGHKWKILVYPKGYGVNFLSAYVNFVVSETMLNQSIVPADISLNVVNQISVNSSVKKTFTYNYQKGKTSRGYKCLVPLSDLQSKGFIVDDALIVEAEVSTKVAAASKAAANTVELIVIEDDQPHEYTIVSLTNPPSEESQANGNTCGHLSTSSVQLSCRNLISELSAMINCEDSSSSDCGLSLLQQQKEKLVGFFDMSLESICQTKSLDEVETIALEILAQATDPLVKTVLKDLLSCLAEFKETVPSSISTIDDTSCANETSIGQMTKDLVHKKAELTSMNAEISRLGEESLKLDVEMHQLSASKAKILDDEISKTIQLQKGIEETSKVLDELCKQNRERKEAALERWNAMDELSRSNASWKLFKDNFRS